MQYEHDESTVFLVKKASRLFVRLANQYLKDRGIGQAYIPFLLQLWHEDGQTQSALHRKIGIEQPVAVRTLGRMERDQLIKRVRSESDRRIIKIHLTPKAKQLYPVASACRQIINQIGTVDFSNHEKDLFNEFLKRMIIRLEENIENQFV